MNLCTSHRTGEVEFVPLDPPQVAHILHAQNAAKGHIIESCAAEEVTNVSELGRGAEVQRGRLRWRARHTEIMRLDEAERRGQLTCGRLRRRDGALDSGAHAGPQSVQTRDKVQLLDRLHEVHGGQLLRAA